MSSIPNFKAPNISTPNASQLKSAVSAAASAQIKHSIPTIPSPASALSSTTNKIKQDVSANIKSALPKFPTLPKIPGLGLSGIISGGGPEFLKSVVPTFQSLVPKFFPGLTINMGAIGAAISIGKSISSGGVSGIINQVSGEIVGEVQGEINSAAAAASSGIKNNISSSLTTSI